MPINTRELRNHPRRDFLHGGLAAVLALEFAAPARASTAIETLRLLCTGPAGGANPCFSLFAGSGGSATFVASNHEQAFSTGGDFGYTGTLSAGVYQLTIGVFANLSFAENLGSGNLADGFTALGTPGSLGSVSYRVVVATAVPEAASWALLLAGLLAVGWAAGCKHLLNSRTASVGVFQQIP